LRLSFLLFLLILFAFRLFAVVRVFAIFARSHICVSRWVTVEGPLGPSDSRRAYLIASFFSASSHNL
jgi:hypothetical protein